MGACLDALLARHSLNGRLGGAVAVGQVKVCQHDVARAVQQDILWLQISVHVAQQMQVLQGQ